VAPPIFRHRLILNFAAQSESVTPDDLIHKILAAAPGNAPLR
jgi:MoxR-like ATPase